MTNLVWSMQNKRLQELCTKSSQLYSQTISLLCWTDVTSPDVF